MGSSPPGGRLAPCHSLPASALASLAIRLRLPLPLGSLRGLSVLLGVALLVLRLGFASRGLFLAPLPLRGRPVAGCQRRLLLPGLTLLLLFGSYSLVPAVRGLSLCLLGASLHPGLGFRPRISGRLPPIPPVRSLLGRDLLAPLGLGCRARAFAPVGSPLRLGPVGSPSSSLGLRSIRPVGSSFHLRSIRSSCRSLCLRAIATCPFGSSSRLFILTPIGATRCELGASPVGAAGLSVPGLLAPGALRTRIVRDLATGVARDLATTARGQSATVPLVFAGFSLGAIDHQVAARRFASRFCAGPVVAISTALEAISVAVALGTILMGVMRAVDHLPVSDVMHAPVMPIGANQAMVGMPCAEPIEEGERWRGEHHVGVAAYRPKAQVVPVRSGIPERVSMGGRHEDTGRADGIAEPIGIGPDP